MAGTFLYRLPEAEEGADMLTIKVIDVNGCEFVKSDVISVCFNPPNEQFDSSLFVWYKDKPTETFRGGMVYVMNENGKTVADYVLVSRPM
jgi:hypothetical protein